MHVLCVSLSVKDGTVRFFLSRVACCLSYKFYKISRAPTIYDRILWCYYGYRFVFSLLIFYDERRRFGVFDDVIRHGAQFRALVSIGSIFQKSVSKMRTVKN